MKAAIFLIKNSSDLSHSDTLKTLYASKLSLSYHKNFYIVKITVKFLQNIHRYVIQNMLIMRTQLKRLNFYWYCRYSLNSEDHALTTKLILSLLANADTDVQYTTYLECHTLVRNTLGVNYNSERSSWENLIFLFEPSVLTEIIAHGVTNDDKKVRNHILWTFIY